MINRQLLNMMNDPDPARRRRAVKRLARSGTPAALQHLEHIARSDADAEVRGLAAQAQRYIEKTRQKKRLEAPPIESAAAGQRRAAHQPHPPRRANSTRQRLVYLLVAALLAVIGALAALIFFKPFDLFSEAALFI